MPLRTSAALRALPSGRSICIGLALAALAALTYLGARESSLFAIREIRVAGVQPDVGRDVRRALAPLEGESLLKLRFGDVDRLATALPSVASVSYDRAFPNTLRVTVTPEVPLAVARQGASSWLVARSGRVIDELARGARPGLPRIWLPRIARPTLGEGLASGGGAEQVAALAPLEAAGLARRVATVRIEHSQITYVLRNGVEVRAGGPVRLALKLEITQRILASVPLSGYLDVSVPERPVAGDNSQLSGGG